MKESDIPDLSGGGRALLLGPLYWRNESSDPRETSVISEIL
jgi:hypothetical protein